MEQVCDVCGQLSCEISHDFLLEAGRVFDICASCLEIGGF
jgi:hypothetical protein